jgi:hypothetical protein
MAQLGRLFTAGIIGEIECAQETPRFPT